MTAKKASKKTKPRPIQEAPARQTAIQSGWPSERVSLTWIRALFLLHCLGLASLFVPLTGLFDNQPIIEQDWGLHSHHLKSLEASFQFKSAMIRFLSSKSSIHRTRSSYASLVRMTAGKTAGGDPMSIAQRTFDVAPLSFMSLSASS